MSRYFPRYVVVAISKEGIPWSVVRRRPQLCSKLRSKEIAVCRNIGKIEEAIINVSDLIVADKSIARSYFQIAYNVLRHRLILTYEAEAENIRTDDVIKEILTQIEVS